MEPQPPRTPSGLSDSVHRQLNLYALAATAAGVGVVASGSPAEAKVVYTPGTVAIRLNSGWVGLDLNHDGIIDFQLNLFSEGGSCKGVPMLGPHYFRALQIYTHQSNQAWALKTKVYFPNATLLCAAALPEGKVVGPHGHFEPLQAGQMLYAQSAGSWGTDDGCPWKSGVQAFLGLKFAITGQIHFGWARVLSNGIGTAYISGYAYETIPNKAIIAGKIKGPDVVTVQPASLGHLAAGAAAIPAWRSGK